MRDHEKFNRSRLDWLRLVLMTFFGFGIQMRTHNVIAQLATNQNFAFLTVVCLWFFPTVFYFRNEKSDIRPNWLNFSLLFVFLAILAGVKGPVYFPRIGYFSLCLFVISLQKSLFHFRLCFFVTSSVVFSEFLLGKLNIDPLVFLEVHYKIAEIITLLQIIIMIIGELRDLEEELERTKRLNESLWATREQYSEAVQASTSKSQFLANMSHELRTPVAAASGIIELLEQTDLNEDQRNLLVLMATSMKNLLAILNDILDLSKIEAGKIEVQETICQLSEIIRSVTDLLKPSAQKKNLRFDVIFSDNLPRYILTDRLRLTQVLLNLCGNAIKFTETGSVSVTVSRADPSPEGDCMLKFAVTDTGIGIEEHIQSQLFEPFTQGDASTTRRFGGTGLGLAISKKLVTLLGGEIKLSSKPGFGSCFSFTVRAPEAQGTSPHAPRLFVSGNTPMPNRNRSPIRVLLAEDQEIVAKVTMRHLQSLGYEALWVQNGLEAVEAVERTRYDLILMDLHMPVMGGMEAARTIRGLDPPLCSIPIIALTADQLYSPKDENETLFSQQITKPCQRIVLQRCIENFVKGKSPETSARGASTPPPGERALGQRASISAPETPPKEGLKYD